MANAEIKKGEHIFITGMTGSGKSYLAETYLAGEEYVIKLDTKNETEERRNAKKSPWTGLKENEDFSVVEHFDDLLECEFKKIIYVPSIEEQTKETYDNFFKFCYLRQNTNVWIDELMSVCQNAYDCPTWLRACYTRGRSKGVNMWALSQRPATIPNIILANSTHFFVFMLNQFEDRQKMSKATGQPCMMNKIEKYYFWYYNISMDNAVKGTLR